jgi:hypothetical protein
MSAEPRTTRWRFKVLHSQEEVEADKAEMERPLTPEEIADRDAWLTEYRQFLATERRLGPGEKPDWDVIEELHRMREARIGRLLGEDCDDWES